MKGKRQLSHIEEFQMFYVHDSHLKRLSTTPDPWSVGFALSLPSKKYRISRKEKIEKSGENHLGQVIKIKINSDKSCRLYAPLMWCDGILCLWAFSQKHCNFNLIMRKKKKKQTQIEKQFAKCLVITLQNC